MNLYTYRLRLSLFLLISVLFGSVIKSQEMNSFTIDIEWKGVVNEVDAYQDTIRRISFDNACYDYFSENQNPVYKCQIPIYSDDVEADVFIDNINFEPLPENELLLLNQNVGNTPLYNYYIQTSRNSHLLCLELTPFFKKDGKMMRVISCDVHYMLKSVKKERSAVFAENSVLASGRWYKMSLTSTGIYKITYSELAAMGVPVSSINPKNIKLFHNGGGVLPAVNMEKRNDDLVEIPIYVSGENDGSFDQNDYVVFYARGPLTWKNVNGIYEKITNPYSDYSYVFLTTDSGDGKRIENADLITENYDVVVNSFVDYQIVEKDVYNLNNMGATYYYDKFDAVTTMTYAFKFPNLIKDKKCNMYAEVASRNFSSASFTFKANGKQITKLSDHNVVGDGLYANVMNTSNVKFNSSSDGIDMEVTYSRSSVSSAGWLDYISINAWRNLKFTGGSMAFRNPECFSDSKIYRYEIASATSSMQVWDVSNPCEPKKMQLQYSSNKAAFSVKGSDNNEFIAFDGTSYKTVTFVSTVANQNLHSKYDFDYLIITHPDFYSQSERLKEIHSGLDDLEIEIVTPQQIYNEFSCGAQDITAIRDYIRMLYKKSGQRLRYVLLFGDASYDYKNKSGKVCFIPSFESETSCSNACIVTDDYFVCLDDNEGVMNGTSLVDVAIGRMPVSNQEDADAMIDKIERYVSVNNESMGSWRKVITFVSDDDATYYMRHAEQLEELVKENGGDDVVFDKIYLDAYPQVATSSGQRAPECNAAITNRVELGTSIINYIGHAGEVGWAAERILTNEDIFSWRNSPKLHLMITASCEFSRFDDHTRTSAGEYVFLNHNGGAIAMMTTARVTYSDPNLRLMKLLYEHLFDMEGGEFITMGDVYVHAKQVGDQNSKAYVFFGDPALRLNYPKNIIELTSVNEHDITVTDTLKALQDINIKGVVNDAFGNHISDFNGILEINVYDKDVSYNTYGNEASPFAFKLKNSLIYTGKTHVENGTFSANFTLPKDINYSYGNGLISMYAYDDKTDAHGSFSDIIVGGMNQDAETDEAGPEIKLYIDDEKFVDGSMTNENPLLIVYLRDENGINTSGAGIGHDITASLSGATDKTYVINQFYNAPLSNDEFGYLTYKFYNLNEGEHELTLKAWDIYNNSNSATITFNVVNGKIIEIENIANYPNPMSDNTNFTFEHNQKDNEIDVKINIYNVMGQLVKTIEEHRYGTSARIEPVRWNGKSDDGSPLSAGLYLYHVTIRNSQGEETSGYSKLVIE